MNVARAIGLWCVAALLCPAGSGLMAQGMEKVLTPSGVLAAAQSGEWRPLDPENTLYMELEGGRVIIELAADFAPRHVANVKALAREHYFDGLAVVRVQENYVTQWGDPLGDDPQKARPMKNGKRSLQPEFDRPLQKDLPFFPLPDGDVYAPEVGFTNGFPVARDPREGRMWLVHCYGMVGAGRGNTADSGCGAEMYVNIGQAPRNLDRNVTLFGRVIRGMELLSALPRGKGPMGFYEQGQKMPLIRSVRLAADLPEEERTPIEVLRTDSETFGRYIQARRNRADDWYLHKAGRVDIGAVQVPCRDKR